MERGIDYDTEGQVGLRARRGRQQNCFTFEQNNRSGGWLCLEGSKRRPFLNSSQDCQNENMMNGQKQSFFSRICRLHCRSIGSSLPLLSLLNSFTGKWHPEHPRNYQGFEKEASSLHIDPQNLDIDPGLLVDEQIFQVVLERVLHSRSCCRLPSPFHLFGIAIMIVSDGIP